MHPSRNTYAVARGDTVLTWKYLGRVDYARALALQEDKAAQVALGGGPCLLCMEHPPTITMGRQADQNHLRLSLEEYRRRGLELFQTKRGGDVTYHGPGQLIAYPIGDLRQAGLSIPAWVRGHGEAICAVLAELGLSARWSDRHPGVWVDGAKVAALGFRVVHGVSTHGMALNVDCDLSAFDTIVPCGLRSLSVTSLVSLGVKAPSLEILAGRLARAVAAQFGWPLCDGDLDLGWHGMEGGRLERISF